MLAHELSALSGSSSQGTELYDKPVAMLPNMTATLDMSRSAFSSAEVCVRIFDHHVSKLSGMTTQLGNTDMPLGTGGRLGVDEPTSPPDPRNVSMGLGSFASVSPLRITERSFKSILDCYGVESDFLNIAKVLGAVPVPADDGDSSVRIQRKPEGTSSEATQLSTASYISSQLTATCFYRLKYVEKNRRSTLNPWSTRHTGVYHQYHVPSNSSLWILLHPSEDTAAEQYLDQLSGSTGRLPNNTTLENPFALHQAFCDLQLHNWEEYVKSLDNQFKAENDEVYTFEPELSDFERSIEQVRKLRHLQDTVVTAQTLCGGNLDVTKCLEGIDDKELRQYVLTMTRRLQAYDQSLSRLHSRIQNSIELLQFAATVKNQNLAADLNRTLLSLTYNTLDDSRSVKVITVLSLIFLPGSFIGTLYGMNFFVFQDGGLVRGENFWIFIVTWIPVTLLTLAVYLYVVWRRRRTMHGPKTLIEV